MISLNPLRHDKFKCSFTKINPYLTKNCTNIYISFPQRGIFIPTKILIPKYYLDYCRIDSCLTVCNFL